MICALLSQYSETESVSLSSEYKDVWPPHVYDYIPAVSVTAALPLSPPPVATTDIPTADNVAYGVATQVPCTTRTVENTDKIQ